jgi:hypothetical protein
MLHSKEAHSHYPAVWVGCKEEEEEEEGEEEEEEEEE